PESAVLQNFLQVPYFKDILQCAREFSSAHQSLATLMVNMGVLTKKKFYLSFIHEVVSVHLKRDPQTVSKIVCSAEELDGLVSLLFSELNPRLLELGLRLTSVADEETGREMVVLVSEDVLPRDISSISGFSADELLLFSRYIPQFVDGGGQCESSWALNEATKLPNPITLVKAQNFLDKLVSVGWISEKGDTLWLQPRAIAELEPVLTTRYGCSICILCQKKGDTLWLQPRAIAELEPVLTTRYGCSICILCQKVVVRYAASSEADDISCPRRGSGGCDQMFSKSDVTTGFN
ncbi:hypothetical protein OSTOST_06139, partial [Ostertagia ostertagi]